MLKNYFKIALRTLYKNKLHSFINIFGLGVAIGVCIVGYVNYKYSQSFDKFHEHGDRIYGVHSERFTDGHESQWSENPIPLGPAIKENIPGISAFVRGENCFGIMRCNDKVFYEMFNFVDPDFLKMFSFPLIKGKSQALDSPYNMVISQYVAERFWGEEDPIGKQVTISLNSKDYFDFNISGVIQNAPNNTALQYSILLPYSRIQDVRGKNITDWKNRTEACLIQIKDNTSAKSVEDELQTYLSQTNFPNPKWQVKRYYLEPLHRMAYIEDDISGSKPYNESMHPAAIITPSVIALFVLILACFNFVNISISSSAQRLKEIGIRKTIGALRSQIILQFMGENIILCLMALILGFGFGEIFVSVYDQLWPDISLVLNYSKDSEFILFLIGVIMFSAILAALYPAVFISRFSPVGILKGKNKFVTKNLMLKLSVATQFVLVIINLMAAIAIATNADYYKTMDPGFRVNDIIRVPVQDAAAYEVFKNSIQNHKDIISIAGTQSNFGYAPHFVNAEVDNRKMYSWRYTVGEKYLETMGVNILEGRNFDDDIQSDQDQSIIVNKKFCEIFGLDLPIGKMISLYRDDEKRTYNIIGVINDFHVRDIDNPVEPAVIIYSPPSQYSSMAIYFNKDQYKSLMAFLQQTWQRSFPHLPFEGYPLENIRENDVRLANTISTVFLYISIIVIAIIAMGLFALIALNIEKKTKEIAVRKILGASLNHISKIIIKEFVLLFFIALCIAAGMGTFLLSMMMGSIWKEYTGLGALPIIAAAVVIILIAGIVMALQLHRIRGANPVDALRAE